MNLHLFQTTKNFVEYDGMLYEILKKINESHKPILENWKEHLGADKIFRVEEPHGTSFMFLKEVIELEILEFVPNSTEIVPNSGATSL